jgi:hypothetical protein
MSATYVRGGRDDTAVGGFIIVAVSFASALLVILALIYATGTNARHKQGMAEGGCVPSLFVSGLPCTTEQMLVTQYDTIVTPAARQLTTDTAVYTANENRNLTTAETVLMAEVTTEQTLSNDLTAATYTDQNRQTSIALVTTAFDTGSTIPSAAVLFAPQMTSIVNALINANQTRVTLTTEQARATSLAKMRALNTRVEAADTAVQAEATLLLKAIDTSLQDN